MKKAKKKDDNNFIFIIILILIASIIVFLFPNVNSFLEKHKFYNDNKTETVKSNENRTVTQEALDSLHYPIMRNSVYDKNTYYSLDKFTISSMSNNDILYNAFLDIYDGNIVDGDYNNSCSNEKKMFSSNYINLRIKNILNRNIKYDLEEFYVPEDANTKYPGIWRLDGNNYIYIGLCESRATNEKYYNLEQFINAEYIDDDLIVTYYVGFAKVIDNEYIIYSDSNMSNIILKGELEGDLNETFKKIDNSKKKKYQYTFNNTLCTYDEYCLYDGKWLNE